MNKLGLSLVLLVSNSLTAVCSAKDVLVSSPDGAVTVTVGVKNNQPYYTMNYHSKIIVLPSHLGFQVDNGNIGSHVKMTGKQYASKDETWSQVWGEDELVRNHYNELTVSFQEQTGAKKKMDVQFRVFNDGIGFRYILPEKIKGEKYCVQEELTEIALAHDAKAWSIPSNHTEYFEGIYTCDLMANSQCS